MAGRKHSIQFTFVILITFLMWDTCMAHTYRVNNHRNTPGILQTLKQVNELALQPGDSVLFCRGTSYQGHLMIVHSGADGAPIFYGSYGKGNKPVIAGNGEYRESVLISNAEYIQFHDLEITNTGKVALPGRKGVHMKIWDFGIAHSIHLSNLFVHDVNGSNVKKEGGGAGIHWTNGGESIKSAFDGLIIENCRLERTDRNGITGSGYWRRSEWFPSRHVVIRGNFLKDIGGDGIVPIGCDSALIENNRVSHAGQRFPEGDAAAGIWPWSCDNTLIQYNEVAHMAGFWDAQGFDSDWNCRNSIFQYNFSHDNEGGFFLICSPTEGNEAGNSGTVVRYNISKNDGFRTTGKAAGFSPVFHITGPVKNTRIYNNVIYINRDKNPKEDRDIIAFDTWGGDWPDSTFITNNLFSTKDTATYTWGKSTNIFFRDNHFTGIHLKNFSDAVQQPGHYSDTVGKLATRMLPVARGWANNSVNATVFRKNSLATYKDMQYVAFYDGEMNVVLGKRNLNSSEWELQKTPYKGDVTDAHKSISIIIDGKGYLHVAWDQHNNVLTYARSTRPGSLVLTNKMSMTGQHEEQVTYPEFYKMPDGGLLFFYRDGGSGNGRLVINTYDAELQRWTQLQSNLLDGEGERNAYWQAYVDHQGTIHLSWVWRETWDVSTNHDLNYARSSDGGKTWESSQGDSFTLPITQENAEIAWRIPQRSALINQTSMTADKNGHPLIATYWRQPNAPGPQYIVVYLDDDQWKMQQVSERVTSFSLSGVKTKRIPIARPQILTLKNGEKSMVLLITREETHGNRPSVYISEQFPLTEWKRYRLSTIQLGSWEPSYDTELWKNQEILDVFIQKVEQIDGEGVAAGQPTLINILEWIPKSP